jgi:hypothetical protein
LGTRTIENPRSGCKASVSADAATADCDETLRTRRPPTAACGGTSPTGGEVGFEGGDANGGEWGEASVSADVATADCDETLRTRRPPTAACGGTSTTGGEESCTNEPELHEDVSCSQAQEIVEVTVDSGGESRLDNVADLLGAGGREAPEVGDPEFVEEVRVGDEAAGEDVPRLGAGQTTRSVGEAVAKRSLGTRRVEDSRLESGSTFRTRRPPTAACGGTSPTGGEVGVGAEAGNGSADCGEGFRTRRPPTAACGGTSTTGGEVGVGAEAGNGSADCGEAVRTRRPPTAACGGTSTTGGEEELLAVETVKRQARAGPMADAIRDLLASSPEAMEVLKPFLPGSPGVSGQ